MTEPTPDLPRQQATDAFIAQTLPDWLKNADHEQLLALRSSFDEHIQSQQKIQQTFARLQPIDTFATALLEERLRVAMALNITLVKAQWREERFKKVDDVPARQFESYFLRQPALQRLMQNFKAGDSFYPDTGLVYPHDPVTGDAEEVLTTSADTLVETCRVLDVGKQYQQHLDMLLDADCMALIAEDKRLQLALAIEIAALKEQLSDDDLAMLRRILRGKPPTHARSNRAYVGALTVLGCRVEGAIAFECMDVVPLFGSGVSTVVTGVILYLPDDPEQSLRAYGTWREASLDLGRRLREPGYQRAFSQRIALADRLEYLTTLSKRLGDAQTDAQCACEETHEALFATLAAQQLQRIRDNAAFIAVPTAQVDARVSAQRLKTLEAIGMGLLNLAGLFVPVIGEVLAADMIGQTLKDVCEGVQDWHQGHRHEAIEHLLGVAETVVLSAALVGGTAVVARGFTRCAQVDQLLPVLNDGGAPRLWDGDISHFEDKAPPTDLLALDNGLLAKGEGRWWRNGDTYYQVRPVPGRSAWQLCHPQREASFGPVLEFNGERSWRLPTERPLMWQGEGVLLGRLWPPAAALSERRVGQILKVADVDQEHLRGLLVEARPLPVALRDTVERFAVEARIEAFFTQLAEGQPADAPLWQWCMDSLRIEAMSLEEQRLELLDDAAELREQLLEHFSRQYLATDPLLPLIRRDFNGLPDAYALDVLKSATDTERQWMLREDRIPLPVAEKAREHLQLARLTRMREGLYLKGSYHPDTVKLMFALLRQQANLTGAVDLELREGSDVGRLLAQLQPDKGSEYVTTVLVKCPGGFKCYDAQGRELAIDLRDPVDIADVLARHLAPGDLARLTWDGSQAPEQIRNALRSWLPRERQAQADLIGLREIKPSRSPLRRLADGRIGYLLNGRDELPDSLREDLVGAVADLFPSFRALEVDRYVSILLEAPESAYATMIRLYREYLELDRALHAWMQDVPPGNLRGARHHVAGMLRRSWRLEGLRINAQSVSREYRRLSLVGVEVGSLPTLPVGTRFSHVTDLGLIGLRLQTLPQGFLSCFTGLRSLNLSNNALTTLPADIVDLNQLSSLYASHNRIRMSETVVASLGALSQLDTLDLSFNRLGGASLQVGELPHLRELNLQRANLQELPVGLERCVQLVSANLRDNHIARLRPSMYTAPLQLRRAVSLENNPLPLAERERFHAVNPQASLSPEPAESFAQAREDWLQQLDASARVGRESQWDALQALDESSEFFSLLRALTLTSDFQREPQDLARRVWAVIEAASEDAALRDELFETASSRGCVDSVISCFSAQEVGVMVARAMRVDGGLAQQGALLELATGLFRLEQVEAQARLDIERRVVLEEDRLRNLGLAEADAQARARDSVDEIEVSLAYRIGLARVLNLPGQPRTMQFEQLANVSQEQLDTAAAAVRGAQNTGALVTYIGARNFWIKYLQEHHEAEFAQLRQPFDEQTEAERPLDEVRGLQIQHAYNEAEQRLILRLTHNALNE
ncbi:NEL-type E3 ubiquitin ligase domain-containing protein [Pseudomonas kermanshahensis]|uniref:NEL-type E3 ubiquitin ligase domain-containing protein n=1 Tax=Pseudomonas kermanshahensis TaxID=2745482 RepID=UPI0023DA34C2|nr:NEL-type E3 ubiquitin ligase domain-containing protein [Pseudomonas kermanshahensis]WEL57213.1 NEL-type E3 ubiquitin ligase domain-containing protein [Pseudomonas kermanshahensis]